MPNTINKTISLTIKSNDNLEELTNKSHFGYSVLFRAFIKYFKDNPKEFENIGDYIEEI